MDIIKQKVTVNGDDHKETHEIYAVFLPDSLRILYIGEGLKGRHKHTFSGKSHVRALNTIHKRGVPIRVDVMGVKDKDRGVFLENALIKALQPRYNVVAKEFYLSSAVKSVLTPFLRDHLTLYLREADEITSEPLKRWLEERSQKILEHRENLKKSFGEKEEVSENQREDVIVRAPEGATYLKDFMPDEGLPKNCLFDKVLTGCGGTYLALMSSEPYIIAVPTKALVHDKITSPTYKDINLQGVSQDYPIGSRCMANYDKIIITYKSLPRVCERLCLDRYNLLVDEVHMLANMSGYAKDELLWRGSRADRR